MSSKNRLPSSTSTAAAHGNQADAAPLSGASILIVLLLLTVAAWIPYGRADRAPFIFDDRMTIEDNPSIRSLWPLWGDIEHPGPLNPPRDISSAGRPLVNLTFALNYAIGGLNTWGYHVANITIHILNALLIWAIVRRTLLLDRFNNHYQSTAVPLACAAALLWCVHPLLSETVLYVTQRTELTVAFFYLATLYASLRYWSSAAPASRKTWLAVASVACLAGMASKEVMATAPIAVFLFERTFLARPLREIVSRSWPLYVGLALGWILLGLLNYSGPRAASAGFDVGVPAMAWWLTQCQVLLIYLRMSVWPTPLVIHYELPYLDSIAAAWPRALLAALFIAVTAVLLWRRSAAGFVGAWVLLILAPTLLVPIVTEIAAERRMYLPLAALVPLAVVAIYRLASRLFASASPASTAADRRALMITMAAVVFLVLTESWASARRAEVYNDAIGIWQDAAQVQPDNSKVQNNLGVALVEAERTEEALPHYIRALELKPDYTEAQSNLGVALVKLGRTDEARLAFAKALELDDEYADAHINLGHLIAQSGDHAAAIDHYRRALKRKPLVAKVHANLGHELVASGKPEEGIKEFREALRLRPDLAEAHLNLGAELAKTGKLDEAAEEYRQALQTEPELVEARSNFGAVLNALGKPQEGIDELNEAIRLRPEYAQAHSNLGIVLFGQGKTDEGLAEFAEAARLQPGPTEFANLAMAYAQLGRSADAIGQAEQAIRFARGQGDAALADKLQVWLDNYRRSLRAP